jgi:hypothetical protein
LISGGFLNGNSNITIAPNSNVGISVGGTANVVVVSTGGANISGYTTVANLVVTGLLFANGTSGTKGQTLISGGATNTVSWSNTPITPTAALYTNKNLGGF